MKFLKIKKVLNFKTIKKHKRIIQNFEKFNENWDIKIKYLDKLIKENNVNSEKLLKKQINLFKEIQHKYPELKTQIEIIHKKYPNLFKK